MPVNNPGGSGADGSGAGGGSGQQQQGGQRATFRPPWVKQGPQPIPMPTAPWAPNRRTSNAEAEPAPAPVRKQSKITIIPSHPTNQTQPQQQAAAPRENGQNSRMMYVCHGGQQAAADGGVSAAAGSGSAFARLAALVRKVEDMERRHDEAEAEQAEQQAAARRPSLANLTALDRDDTTNTVLGVAVDEPDWWRALQQTARAATPASSSPDPATAPATTTPSPSPGADDVQDLDQHQRLQGSSDQHCEGGGGAFLVEERWSVRVHEEEIVEYEEVFVDQEADDVVEHLIEGDVDEEEEGEDGVAEPAGGRGRPATRVVTVEREAAAPAPAAPTPAPAKRPSADNGRPAEEPRRRPTLTHQKSSNAARPASPPASASRAPPPPPAPPAPPPAPPMAPPMAPPPPPVIADKKPMTVAQQQKLEQLRNRARKRPDYSCLMKEIESGTRLRKVQCNDRSRPLLPKTKVAQGPSAQFVYESEKSNMHNQLLKQIEGGVKLKKVKCNDRSRPLLDGLRKFRRQMTIEEQIQKSVSMASIAAEPLADEPDDLDDIDCVRDDLQSTKQMLALELRNKEALERENKRLLARLLNLEAELEAERSRKADGGGGGSGPAPDSDKLVAKLKEENEAQQKVAKEMEARYHQSAEELDAVKAQLQEALFQRKQAEKQLREIEDGLVEGGRALQKQLSKKLISSKSGDIRKQMSQARLNELRKQSVPVLEAKQEDSESEYTDETVTDSEEDEEEEDLSNDPEAQERRVQRELKLLATKLKAFKDKEASARRERTALREQLKLQQKALKEERAKYKSLQKEVDKMAKLLKDEDDEDAEEEEDEAEDEEEEESESESEESDGETEASGDELPADAPVDDKRNNLNARTKRHEGILGALKKGNYLLKANIDRIKDDLSKHREMSLMLQEDLNSVLAELG